jgi:hypothetical protein
MTPLRMQVVCTTRAKMWARGRKNRVRIPPPKNSGPAAVAVWVASHMKLWWVMTQPLGLPVVPEV